MAPSASNSGAKKVKAIDDAMDAAWFRPGLHPHRHVPFVTTKIVTLIDFYLNVLNYEFLQVWQKADAKKCSYSQIESR
jgi:hypothetical protein